MSLISKSARVLANHTWLAPATNITVLVITTQADGCGRCNLVLAGPSLHWGLNAPPTASQAFVPRVAGETRSML
jgi:hypothetical protein